MQTVDSTRSSNIYVKTRISFYCIQKKWRQIHRESERYNGGLIAELLRKLQIHINSSFFSTKQLKLFIETSYNLYIEDCSLIFFRYLHIAVAVCANVLFLIISRRPNVSGRDTNVLVPNLKTSRQTQAVLRPEHGPAQHASARAAQE